MFASIVLIIKTTIASSYLLFISWLLSHDKFVFLRYKSMLITVDDSEIKN